MPPPEPLDPDWDLSSSGSEFSISEEDGVEYNQKKDRVREIF